MGGQRRAEAGTDPRADLVGPLGACRRGDEHLEGQREVSMIVRERHPSVGDDITRQRWARTRVSPATNIFCMRSPAWCWTNTAGMLGSGCPESLAMVSSLSSI